MDSYPAWADYYEDLHGLSAGSLADKTGDADGDGLVQLFEYALEASGADPLSPDASLLPQPVIADGELILEYPSDPAKADVTVRALVSPDLVTWHAAGEPGAPSEFSDIAMDAPGPVDTRRASIDLSAGSRFFLRLEVEASD